jgi:hypothetical protein
MKQYWPRFVELRNHSDSTFPEVALLGFGGCPFLSGVNRIGIAWDGKPWDCPQFLRTAIAFASQPQVKTVVFSSFIESYFYYGLLIPKDSAKRMYFHQDDPRVSGLWESFELTVSNLVASGKKVYLVLPGPIPRRLGMARSTGGIPPRLSGLFGGKILNDSIDKARFLAFTARDRRYMQDIATRTGAQTIDPVPFLCGETMCATVSADGLPIFRDDNHLRPGYVQTKVTYLDRVVQR